MIFLAHGIGGVRDLPVPESFFFTTAAIVLVVSFVLLGLLWKRPLLEAHAEGRLLPRVLSAFFLSTPLRVVLQLVSVFVFVVTLATALLGTTTELLNFAPTFVYVIFWLGVPLLSVLFGNVWRALSPWRAIADGAVWLLELGGREARPVLQWSGRWGRYPAAAALFSFVALELDESKTGLPSDARDRDRPLLVLGACRAWRCTVGKPGRAAARASPSCSSCSRASRRSPSETAASSCAGRSPASRGPIRLPERCCSSP